MSNCLEDLKRMCEGIKEDLTNVYNGNMIWYNYEFYNREELEIQENDEGCECYVIDDELVEVDEVEEIYMFDYLIGEHADDIYDIEYTVGSDREFRAVKLMVACGGPNLYINTNTGNIEGRWWGDNYDLWLPHEICEEINEVFDELFNC